MENQKLGLTVLRSPIYGDLRISELDDSLDYDFIDLGIVEGNLRVSFEGMPWNTAESFLNPPTMIIEANHDGDPPPQNSFLSVEGNGISLMTYKFCEDDSSAILRLNENLGGSCTARISIDGYTHSIPMSPYEIKTIKLTQGTWQEVNMLEEFN